MTVSTSTVRGFALVVVGVVALFLLPPAVFDSFNLDLFSKYICYAIVGLGIGLAWGRGGMLVLGQGVYFWLGGFVLAMHLKMADAGPGGVPDLFKLYGNGEVPGFWKPFAHAWFALPAVLVIPMLLAWALGALVFRRRVKGAFFAILSQALVVALSTLVIGKQALTGGTNGLTNFDSYFGYNPGDPANKRLIYYVAALVLLLMIALVWQIYRSRLGQLLVATRDAEERVRFLGYDPASVKTFAYVIAAGAAAIAGAIFTLVVGAINPSSMTIIPSIEFVIAVAIGGRATLMGPVIGAIAFGFAQSRLSSDHPDTWQYFKGGLLIAVVVLLPDGLMSLQSVAQNRFSRPAADSAQPARPVQPAEPAVMTGVTQ